MAGQEQELRELRGEIDKLNLRVAELDAKQAVRQTVLDYVVYHDRGLSDQLADLFTDDALLEISGFGDDLDTRVEGREAIRAMYRQVDARSAGPPPYKHAITNLRIEIQGDEAVASSYLLDWGGGAGENGPGGSMYHERLVKQADGRWRIRRKRIVSTANLTVDAVLSVDV